MADNNQYHQKWLDKNQYYSNQSKTNAPPEQWSTYQSVNVRRRPRRSRRKGLRLNCLGILILLSLLTVPIFCSVIYFLLPLQTNILILGIDYVNPPSYAARTDTIILTTFKPLKPYIGILSIPRDLWVNIPQVGENRINTAHFFAEAVEPGSGPQASIETIKSNFNLDMDHYIRIRFEGFREVVDAMGGVDINLSEPMAGYSQGIYHLNGRKALAFVRHRMGEDDFYRMEQAQLMIKSIIKQMMRPSKLIRLPLVIRAILRSVETDIPIWLWPRLMFMVLRLGPDDIDNRTINRDMVTPFTTSEGAQVLAPNWELINPVVDEMFRK